MTPVVLELSFTGQEGLHIASCRMGVNKTSSGEAWGYAGNTRISFGQSRSIKKSDRG